MDFSAEQGLRFSDISLSSVVTTAGELPEQRISETVAFEEALVVVNNLVFAKRGKPLSDAEIRILRGGWNNREFVEIAENSPYSANYLQRRLAPQLWDLLSETIGNEERVGKRNLRYFLEQATKKYSSVSSALNKEQVLPLSDFVQGIRGELPDLSNFYGRTQELINLKELIIKQRCVSLIGVAGVGKTALAAKLLAELSISPSDFDCLIWKSVAYAPKVQDLVAELIQLIQPSETSLSLPEITQTMITELVKQLKSRRCLLVLDEFDALFQKNNFEQRLDYRILFRRLVEEQHQSRLLLTSRVLPDEFDSLLSAKRHIEWVRVEGLDADAAMHFLATQGLTDTQKCNELINTYRGNPLELKTVADRINHFFGGSTKIFFQHKTTFFSNELQAMLDEAFGQVLNEIQKQIMIYLADKIALTFRPIKFVEIINDLNQKQQAFVSTSELISALEKLERQSLIESNKDPVTKEISFTLQPAIKKYIMKDPQGLVRISHALPKLANAS
ncbi:MAG: NB-ARC domain-containing protein [Nostoc sp. CmiVER01]|uniref:NB-ARC domain-containing protein n=1 Tax=Nostoc sp. CmiVER01 TaxID=3075384 RepID=UPI003D1613F5